jgi:Flp pilus assembly pilin Flp
MRPAGLLVRVLRDEDGQDLTEYTLLTAFFGLCLLAAWTGIRDALAANYGATSGGLQSIWNPPPPSGS